MDHQPSQPPADPQHYRHFELFSAALPLQVLSHLVRKYICSTKERIRSECFYFHFTKQLISNPTQEIHYLFSARALTVPLIDISDAFLN